MKFYSNAAVSRGLIFLAMLIVGLTLWYTNNLANQFKTEVNPKENQAEVS